MISYDDDYIHREDAIEYAEELGYVLPDPRDIEQIHDAWHTGAIKWCEIGGCVYYV